MSQTVGSSRVTVSVFPDPPRVGTDSVTVTVGGASSTALSRTAVHYATLMPSMNMAGPSGSARAVPGHLGMWRFDVTFGMAAPWALRVQLSGGVNASVDMNLLVGQHTAGQSQAAVAPRVSGGMTVGDGDVSAWRNATFALLGVIVIGGLLLWRDRRPAMIALVVIGGVVVLAIAYAQSRHGSSAMDMGSMQSIQGAAPVPVTLARVGGAPHIGETISAPGSVQPYFVQNIVARAPGVLTDLSAYTGDRLSSGQVIAHLSEPELQANAQAAQAAAQSAASQAAAAQQSAVATGADLTAAREQLRYWNAELVREKTLLAAGAVSTQEYQNERAQAAAARSAYDAARAKIAAANATASSAQAQVSQAAASAQAQGVMAGYTNVVVPDDAVVMKRLVDPGVYVQAGTPILQVAVINRLRVQAQVAQNDLGAVHIGTPIDATFGDGKTVHGRVSSISPVVDPSTHTAIAEAIVSNEGGEQPGAFVHVVLHAQQPANERGFAVPSGAVVGGADTAVWVDREGTAHRVPVTVLSDDGTSAFVSGDLRAGMRVVVAGASDLEEGQQIAQSAQ